MEKKCYVDSEVRLLHSSLSSSEVIDWVSTGSHSDKATFSYLHLPPSLNLPVRDREIHYSRLLCTINSSSLWMSHNFCLQVFADTLHPIVKTGNLPQTGKPNPNTWDELSYISTHAYFLWRRYYVLDNVAASANADSQWLWPHVSLHQKIALKKDTLMQCQAWDLPSAKP